MFSSFGKDFSKLYTEKWKCCTQADFYKPQFTFDPPPPQISVHKVQPGFKDPGTQGFIRGLKRVLQIPELKNWDRRDA